MTSMLKCHPVEQTGLGDTVEIDVSLCAVILVEEVVPSIKNDLRTDVFTQCIRAHLLGK